VVFVLLAVLAGGKDVIVNFPQQSNWTGSVSEMERVSTMFCATIWCVSCHFI